MRHWHPKRQKSFGIELAYRVSRSSSIRILGHMRINSGSRFTLIVKSMSNYTAVNRTCIRGFTARATVVYGSAIILILCSLIVLWTVPTNWLLTQLRSWAQAEGPGAGLAFVLMFVIFTICSIPVWPLPFLAGSLFGAVWGSVLASAACVLAAAITFGIARVVKRTALVSFVARSPRVAALENTIKVGSWRIIAAVRVSHLMTFGIQNYILGLSGVRFWVYVLTTWLVTLPGTILQVYLGDLGFSSMEAWQDRDAAPWQIWALRFSGLILVATAISYFGCLVKKKYLQEVQRQLEQQMHSTDQFETEKRFAWQMYLLMCLDLFAIALATWAMIADGRT
jgi:uncharacterized membrane protein YdjX (TVP38/TMEM64 family)